MSKQTIYDLTPLQIGIGCKNWEFMHEKDPREACIEFMKSKSFDVLPLKNDQDKFNQFLVTEEWNNFSNISLKHKSTLPKLKADSDFITLLKAFIENKQKFLLIYKGTSIVGIISVVNFSYREIYKRLYSLIAGFEIELTNWLFKKMTENEALNILINKSESNINKSAIGQYLIDKYKGNDGLLREYLFLSSLHVLIQQKSLFQELKFSKKEWQELGDPLFKIRNSTAHPVRSIIREKSDFKRLLFVLESIKKINQHI
ncbi:MAG: hypothetical protein ABI462_14570 [Ignavibacteria bacterium]